MLLLRMPAAAGCCAFCRERHSLPSHAPPTPATTGSAAHHGGAVHALGPRAADAAARGWPGSGLLPPAACCSAACLPPAACACRAHPPLHACCSSSNAPHTPHPTRPPSRPWPGSRTWPSRASASAWAWTSSRTVRAAGVGGWVGGAAGFQLQSGRHRRRSFGPSDCRLPRPACRLLTQRTARLLPPRPQAPLSAGSTRRRATWTCPSRARPRGGWAGGWHGGWAAPGAPAGRPAARRCFYSPALLSAAARWPEHCTLARRASGAAPAGGTRRARCSA